MKKKVFFAVMMMLSMASTNRLWAFETSAVAPTGQTLYYNFVKDQTDNEWVAILVHPGNVTNTGSWGTYEMPAGALIIPDSVIRNVGEGNNVPVRGIQSYAFYNCSGLTSVVIPNTVKAIGEYAFYMCQSITSITLPNTLSTIVPQYGANAYPFVPNAIAPFTFAGCFQLSGNISIPEGVTTISDHAFTSTNISSITWPTTVTTIGGLAFASCSSLSSVTIPSSVTTIEGGAFLNCYKTETINVPSTVSFNDYTYAWDVYPANSTFKLVKNINYTGSLIDSNNTFGVGAWGARTLNGYIENGVVYRNQNKQTITACNYEQTSVSLPASVDTIGFGAFLWHNDLMEIVIPEGVVEIGQEAFNSCIGLMQIYIPSTVNTIGGYAFSYCSGLSEITMPAALTYLGVDAFVGCDNLDTLRMLGNVPPMYETNEGWWSNIDQTTGDTLWVYDTTLVNVPIVVPCHAGYAYRHAEGWSMCNNIIDPCGDEVIYYTVTVNSADTTMGTVSAGGEVEEGESFTIRAIANEGYHFTHWNDGDTNAERTVVVTSDTTFTAYFEADEVVTTYTVTVVSANPEMGTVSAGGEVEEGESFTIRAIANEGYHFTHWNDGDTNAERTVVVTSDTTFTAYFEADGGTEGIDGIEAVNAKVYAEHGRIVVEGVEGETVSVFDVAGRQVKNSDLPASVYMVKIGSAPARKVVVTR